MSLFPIIESDGFREGSGRICWSWCGRVSICNRNPLSWSVSLISFVDSFLLCKILFSDTKSTIGLENFRGWGSDPAGLTAVVRFLLKEVHQGEDWLSPESIFWWNVLLRGESILACSDCETQSEEWDERETDHLVPDMFAWLEIVTQLNRCSPLTF